VPGGQYAEAGEDLGEQTVAGLGPQDRLPAEVIDNGGRPEGASGPTVRQAVDRFLDAPKVASDTNTLRASTNRPMKQA
jgi:hypothetical protein